MCHARLVAAAILHGLNDWSRVNGHVLWILVTLVSGILFLGYAKVGSRSDRPAPVPAERHAQPARHAAEVPAGRGAGGARPWWEH